MSEEKKGIADAENSGTAETMADYARELEASFRTIREGDVISGTVIDVRETGVTLDLGYYAPAVIKTEDLSRDPSFSVLSLQSVVPVFCRYFLRRPDWYRLSRQTYLHILHQAILPDASASLTIYPVEKKENEYLRQKYVRMYPIDKKVP